MTLIAITLIVASFTFPMCFLEEIVTDLSKGFISRKLVLLRLHVSAEDVVLSDMLVQV